MHDQVVIAKIQKIEPIEGKDRIVLATVANYKSIIAKDEFKVDDLIVYCTYDTCLPEKPEYEFLRKRCFNSRVKMHRIKPMKLGGIISEGLVLPLTVLPEDKRNLKEGTNVTDIIGAKNYEELTSTESSNNIPQKKKGLFYTLMKYRWFRRIFGNKYEKNRKKIYEYPCPKSDEENIEKIWDNVKDNKEIFYLSEKMEGQSFTAYFHKKKLFTFSHNFYNNSGSFGEVGKIYDLKNGLAKVNKIFNTEVAIQGEICGPGIQKNIYNFSNYRLFLFGAYDVKTKRRMNVDELEKISNILNIDRVPSLGTSNILPSIDDMLSNCDGSSVFKEAKMREGVVWRNYDGSIHFKCKSRPYKVWFS